MSGRVTDPVRHAASGAVETLSDQLAALVPAIPLVGALAGQILDLLDDQDRRVADLERRLAEYDRPASHAPDAAGPPATPPRSAPAAPPPTSPPAAPVLPGQITIGDHLKAANLRTLAGQGNRARLLACLREHYGQASRKTITRASGIKAGSVADVILNAVRDGAVVDTGRREKTKGPSSPIYALPSELDTPEQAAAKVREQDRPIVAPPAHTADLYAPPAPPAPPARASAPARERPAVSPRVRRELERAARDVAGETLPTPKTAADFERAGLLRALNNGPRDHDQLARILGVSPRRAADLMVGAHRDGQVVVEQGVARLV